MNDTVLESDGLTKYYGPWVALDHLALRVPRGCVFGLLGRNGAGKTTAIKLLLGLLRPTFGRAQVLGCDCQHLTPQVRQRVGYVAQGHRLYGWMTIARLETFQRAFFPRGQWNGRLFQEMLEYFGLSTKHKIKHLSTGQRAQVSLALAIAPGPELLIMDDPALGLDAAVRRQFLEGMIHFIHRQGRSILFSSHILSDVERIADRIAILDHGVLRADCRLDEFRAAVRKAIVTFPAEPPGELTIPGLLRARREARRVELTLVGTSDEDIRAWSATAGAAEYKLAAMNLEDQFIEFTAPAHQTSLFQWENSNHEVPGTV
jgi:ABC-2 type transport system ATP-binding protein